MKKKGVLFQYIRHDIRSGIFGQRGKYIAALIIFLFLCASAYRLVCFVGIRSETLPNPTMGDYLYKLLMGMKVYRPGDKEFEVNVLWMLVNFFLAYIVSFYPFKDLHGLWAAHADSFPKAGYLVVWQMHLEYRLCDLVLCDHLVGGSRVRIMHRWEFELDPEC